MVMIETVIPNKVESDYWEWEAAVTDVDRLEELAEWMG